MSYSVFDAASFQDDSETKRAISKAVAPSSVNQEQAQRASAIIKRFPTISKGSLVGAVKLGIAADDPRLQQIVMKESILKEEEGEGKLKSAIRRSVRGTFIGFQNLWEMALPRGVRYLEGRQQGMSHEEASQKSKATLLGEIDTAKAAGKDIDLGQGWFLGSTDPTQTSEYKNLLASGVDPLEAREWVRDNILGVQIYEEQKRKANQIQFVGERAEKFRAAGLDPTVTIGRYLFKPVDDIIEPGTKAYNYITGAIDIVAQIFGDPTAAATLGVSKIRKGASTFSELENLSGMAKIFENTGLLQGARKTVFGPTVQEFMAGKAGIAFKKFLWENSTTDIIAASKNNIDDFKFYDELDKFKAKNKGKSFEEIDADFTENLVKKNLLIEATQNNLPTVRRKGNRLTGMLERTYGTRLITENKDDAFIKLNRFIRLATTGLEETKKVKVRDKFMSDAIKALNAADAPTETAKLVGNFIQRQFRPQVIKALGGRDKLTKFQTELVDKGLEVQARFIGTAQRQKGLVRSYAIDSTGENLPVTQVLRQLQGGKLDGVAELMDPVTAVQLADEIFLPNARQVVRAAKTLDKNFGKIGSKIFASDKSETITRFMDWYYGSLFKPLVLLRPAWTVRVIAEEQIRLLTSGVTNVIEHPASMIARIIGKEKESKNTLLGSFEDNAQFIDVTLNGAGTPSAVRRGYGNTGEFTTVTRQENKRAWGEAVFRNFMQHKFDPLSRRLAQIQLEPSAAKRKQLLAAVIKEAQTQGNVLNKHIRKVTGAEGHAFKGAGFSSKPGNAKAEEFVHYVNAAVAQATGGKVLTSTAKGSPRLARNWIDENGNEDLLKALADENLSAQELVGLENVNLDKYWKGELSPDEYTSITTTLRKNQEKMQKEFVKKHLDVLPESARGELKNAISRESRMLDDFVDDMFNFLMTVPTKKLSRAPAFKFHYWNKVGDFAQHLNTATLKKVVKLAEDAGLATGTSREKKVLKKLQSYKGVKGGVNDVKIIDKVASSHALTETKKLLYDVTTKTRLGNATRAIFPFGEAYVEIFTTWARLINSETLRPLRRVDQVVQSARKPNPIFDDEGQKGFFYKDPNSGEELFGYPGEGLIKKFMFKDLEENGVKVNLPVFAQSLNIAGNIIPGFGPTITVPAAIINKHFNLLRPGEIEEQILFGDFAPPRVDSAAEIIKGLTPVPSWLNKTLTAFEVGGAEAKRQFANTQIDVYKALLYAGQIDDSSPEGVNAGLELAGDYARKIFLIRSASQLIGPSGAVSPKYEISDKTGQMYLFETLAQEYWNISNAVEDSSTAVQVFTDRFGFNPVALATGRTMTVKKRPVTEDGAVWERKNPELVEKFDLTYAFLIDETDSEFMYESYLAQLISGDRVPKTPEQWVQSKNILLGNIEYENFLKKNNLLTRNDKQAVIAKRNKKAEIAMRYPGYGRSIDYSPTKPEIDDLIDELYTWINPVTYVLDPRLVGNPAAEGLKEYLQLRDRVIAETKKIDQTYSDTSFRRANKLAPYRTLLRDKIKAILVTKPEFAPLAKEIFERELREAEEDIELLKGLYDS